MAWKDGIVRRLTGGVAALLNSAGVQVVQAGPRSSTARPSRVATTRTARRSAAREHLLLATGSEPTELPFLPFGGR